MNPSAVAPRPREPLVSRAYRCRCGRPIFFGNHRCLACNAELGYDSSAAVLLPIIATDETPPRWRYWPADDSGDDTNTATRHYRRCANQASAMACTWLIGDDEPAEATLCRSCRLNRTVPDLSDPDNQRLWARVENDKQRLVAALIALKLPLTARIGEDPERGLAFDLLRGQPGAPVMIGHLDGVITLDIEEADDAHREAIRQQFGEPYRTVLGHLRHESGHYYWARLIDGHDDRLAAFRERFGDERADYAAALQRHHAEGAPADWPQFFVSAYASAHPWEDWAETWAHYLHIRDTLDTALSFRLDAGRAGLLHDPFDAQALADDDGGFLALIHTWVELTGVLNELSRSMGERDFYPFVLAAPAVAKLQFVHRLVMGAALAEEGAASRHPDDKGPTMTSAQGSKDDRPGGTPEPSPARPAKPTRPVKPLSKDAGPAAGKPQRGLATSSSGNVHAGMSGKNK